MKDFRPLRLGVLPLKEGRNKLVLKAEEIPGQQAVDVWMLSLRLLP